MSATWLYVLLVAWNLCWLFFLALHNKWFPVCFRQFFERVYPPEQRGEFLDTLLNKFSIRFCDTNPSTSFLQVSLFIITFALFSLNLECLFLFQMSPCYSSLCFAISLYLPGVCSSMCLPVCLSVCLSSLLSDLLALFLLTVSALVCVSVCLSVLSLTDSWTRSWHIVRNIAVNKRHCP